MEAEGDAVRDKVHKIQSIFASLTDTVARPVWQNNKEVTNKKNSTIRTQPHNAEEFYNRVTTFRPGLWSVQELTPLECARWGWQIQEKDVLQCVTCREVVCAILPDVRDFKAYDKYLGLLKDRLLEGHKDACGWRINPSPEEFVQPPYISSIEDMRNLTNSARTLSALNSALPHLNIEALSESLGADKDLIEGLFQNDSTDYEVQASAVLLVLSGWTRGEGAYLRCKVCRRSVGLWNFITRADELDTTRAISPAPTPSGKRKRHGEDREESSEDEPMDEDTSVENVDGDSAARSQRKCKHMRADSKNCDVVMCNETQNTTDCKEAEKNQDEGQVEQEENGNREDDEKMDTEEGTGENGLQSQGAEEEKKEEEEETSKEMPKEENSKKTLEDEDGTEENMEDEETKRGEEDGSSKGEGSGEKQTEDVKSGDNAENEEEKAEEKVKETDEEERGTASSSEDKDELADNEKQEKKEKEEEETANVDKSPNKNRKAENEGGIESKDDSQETVDECQSEDKKQDHPEETPKKGKGNEDGDDDKDSEKEGNESSCESSEKRSEHKSEERNQEAEITQEKKDGSDNVKDSTQNADIPEEHTNEEENGTDDRTESQKDAKTSDKEEETNLSEKGSDDGNREEETSREATSKECGSPKGLAPMSPLIIGSSPSTQIKKIERKQYFHPLEEHRHWCTWVMKIIVEEVDEEMSQQRRGYQMITEQARDILDFSRRKDLCSSEKYVRNVEGLRSIRTMLNGLASLDAWLSEDLPTS